VNSNIRINQVILKRSKITLQMYESANETVALKTENEAVTKTEKENVEVSHPPPFSDILSDNIIEKDYSKGVMVT
jgi:hypothetical protein